MEGELTTIAAAARKFGCARSRLSVWLKEAGVKKIVRDGVQLVALEDAWAVLQQKATDGKIRSKRLQRQPKQATQETPFLIEHLTDEVRRLKEERDTLNAERDALSRRLEAAASELTVLNLLPARDAIADEVRALRDEITAMRLGATATEPALPVLKDPADLKAVVALVEQCRGVEASQAHEPSGFWSRLFQPKTTAPLRT